MGDLYKEHLVKKEKTTIDTLERVGIIALTVVLALGGLFIRPILLAGALVVGILGYIFVFPNTDLEYEYLLVNRSLDIDKVMARTKRKKVKSFDLSTAEIIAPLHSHRLDYYNNNSQMKVQDYSSGNDEHRRFAFIIREDSQACKVIIEPDQDMERMMQQSMPGKCYLD